MERPVKTAALGFMKLMRLRGRSLAVFLVTGSVMDKNVLAFPSPKGFPRPDTKSEPLGEIFLNPDYIKSRGEDLFYMLCHGFLHLLGYNHRRRRDTIKMERKERNLLGKISVIK